jgi:endoglucanase
MSGVQSENTQDVGGGLNVGYIDINDWMDYGYNAPASGSYKISFRLATPRNSAVFQVKAANGSILATITVPNTGSYQTWQTVDAQVTLPQGQQTLRLLSTASDPWNINWLELVQQTGTPPPPPPPTPSGNYVTIPSRIEAENWTAMTGVQAEPTQDAGGGLNVGYIDENDWMEYSINAPAAGTYDIRFRVAAPTGGARLQVATIDGVVLATVTIPNTGSWQTWQTVDAQVTLAQGQQKIYIISAHSQSWNINWVEFGQPDASTPPAPRGRATTRIEAENWSSMNGVQTEGTSDAGGGLNVGYIDNGDWMDYAYNAPVSGTYTINFRVASGGRFSIAANGSTVGAIAWENTGGFQAWQTFSTTVNLSAGQQTIRLTATAGTANINWIEIIAPGAATTAHLATGTEEATAATTPGAETATGAKAAIRVFPNPVEERFTLQLNSDYTGSVKVVIRDTKGSAVKSFTLTKGSKGSFQAYLSLQGVSAGTYTLSTYQKDEQTQSLQIIKR